MSEPQPRLTWALPEDLVVAELRAQREFGTDPGFLQGIEERWREAGGSTVLISSGTSEEPATAHQRALARELLDVLGEVEYIDPTQPDDWEGILDVTDMPVNAGHPPGEAELLDRLHGAWTGRAVGCLLGKPVEKIPREGIEEILREAGRWPLDDYFTAVGLPAEVGQKWPWNRRSAPTSLVENIDGMPEDDDLNFPMLALEILEEHGRGFTTSDVAGQWLSKLPAGRVFTAERAAYRNLLDARPIPTTATHHNPFREWIGALIRTDLYGWVSPGNIRAAAQMGWADSRLSHTRNGLYGGMWAAALGAGALVSTSAREALELSLSAVPPAAALSKALRFGISLGERFAEDIDGGLDALHTQYGGYHWVHTLNNAALAAFALVAGRDDLGRSISIAVTGGWDTDSTAATVGGVIGAVHGFNHLPERWVAPIRGRIATSLPGPAQRNIDDLAKRTARIAQEGLS